MNRFPLFFYLTKYNKWNFHSAFFKRIFTQIIGLKESFYSYIHIETFQKVNPIALFNFFFSLNCFTNISNVALNEFATPYVVLINNRQELLRLLVKQIGVLLLVYRFFKKWTESKYNFRNYTNIFQTEIFAMPKPRSGWK